MDEHRGLRAVNPDDMAELVLPSSLPEPAHVAASSALRDAAERYDAGDHESAAVLAAIGQGWATLALTEPMLPPIARDPELAVCPSCGDDEITVLPEDWQAAVEAGGTIAIIGCGNPWHYVFPR